jgi:hypothetical protein
MPETSPNDCGVFRVPMIVPVLVTINDPDVIGRVTGPKGDEWRSYAYKLHTRDEVLGHLAYNAVANGITSVANLDGWADLSRHDTLMDVRLRDAELADPDLYPINLDGGGRDA